MNIMPTQEQAQGIRTTAQLRPRIHEATRTKPRKAVLPAASKRPRGREAVMAAVRAAATTLFATRGPASVSVRDIAAAAGVNHALVHRHFGSKQEVLRAVLEQAAREMAAIVETFPTVHAGLEVLLTASVEREMYWRTLARAILDGENPHGLQRDFPTIRQLIALLQKERQQSGSDTQAHSPSSLDARVIVGTLSALMLGWVVFEPYLLRATGLEKDDRKQIRGQVVQMLHLMVDGTR